ncbi:sugar ABC transporter ATP-binding protein [Bacillus sp. 1P06AnD]|uniref:sugar ABC transporter ATP-binding protein n=1 Tax=Bacillus sp. 1P06AnD TaxID=3132208 RepID=UPI00399F3FCD
MADLTCPLLAVNRIHKRFTSTPILKGVSLSLHKGEIHALVGGNGAGKSTLMKIICGWYQPDKGTVLFKGKPVHFSKNRHADHSDMYLVPQEPLIFPNMSVGDNITIGMKGKKNALLKKAETIISSLDWQLDMAQKGYSLSIADQQLVEIVRGLMRESEVLILDEPTSTLTFHEIKALFNSIRTLTEKGIGIFYITHRFEEIFQLADTVSVMRDGIVSESGHVSEFTIERLIDGLSPKTNREFQLDTDTLSLGSPVSNDSENVPVLVINNISGNGFRHISFNLLRGEIVGIAGVIGAGRTELGEAIAGIKQIHEGSIKHSGIDIRPFTFSQRMKKGIVYVPEDRQKNGLFSFETIRNNISSTLLQHFTAFFPSKKTEKGMAAEYISKLNIKAANEEQLLQELSGGNQQKVVLAKYLALQPNVIILDEPTRGIDANARKDIYGIIKNLQLNGISIVLISSDMEELVEMSDRIVVLYEGSIAGSLDKEDFCTNKIASLAFGAEMEAKH